MLPALGEMRVAQFSAPLLSRPQPSALTAATLLLGTELFCMFCYFGAQIVTRKGMSK